MLLVPTIMVTGASGHGNEAGSQTFSPTDMSRSRVALTSPTLATGNAVQTCPRTRSAQPAAAFALVCGADRWRQPIGDTGCPRMSGKFKSWPHPCHTCGLGSRHLSQSLYFLIYTSEGSEGDKHIR